ncbi:HNH endonuclease [Paraburkholderia youngii]|uniref:HNH endonuclease n=1 Tax=Paraburkholderia youngii TaxID=2782701 RepID=UPI001591DEAE|nr:HNH endonuclease signature motif containing protein [Paraburkholderia youngii]NUX59342.1 HNH endonuclease [Paraburkholderia youngii]
MARQYRYGNKATWDMVGDAVIAMGRPVTTAELCDYLVARVPDFRNNNLGPDLSVLSVNCYSRANHAVNTKPRLTDIGNKYDRLIRIGKGRGVKFAEYKPEVHGVWELADVGDKKLRPRQILTPQAIEIDEARKDATSGGDFDPTEDARRRIMRTLVQREGQPQFRRALIDEYAGACAISGCAVEALLEAAHIIPYLGSHTNDVSNGLLLRADLHKLFDLHLLRIDPHTRTVHLCDELKASEYSCFEGRRLRPTKSPNNAPSQASLSHHEERCTWTLVESAEE